MYIHLPLNNIHKNHYAEIHWLIVKPSLLHTSQKDYGTSLGVYSARRFEKNALIGIFFQKDKFNEKYLLGEELKYAFKSKHMILLTRKIQLVINQVANLIWLCI